MGGVFVKKKQRIVKKKYIGGWGYVRVNPSGGYFQKN